MGYIDDIRHQLKDEELTNRIQAIRDAQMKAPQPVWDESFPEKYRKSILQMTEKEIREFASWAADNHRSINIGLPPDPVTVEVLMATFKCTQCGKCCVGPLVDGIAILPSEIKRLSKYFGLSESRWIKQNKVFFKEDTAHLPFPCPFLKQGVGKVTCSVYPIRPLVCHIFPLDMTVTGNLKSIYLQAVCPEAKDMIIASAIVRRYLFS